MKKILILILVVGVLFKFGVLENPFGPKQETVSGYNNKVVLYATTWCGYCKKTRDLLKKNGINYVEYDIEKSSIGKEDYKRLNGSGIPLMVIDGNVIRGYNPQQILKYISTKNKI